MLTTSYTVLPKVCLIRKVHCVACKTDSDDQDMGKKVINIHRRVGRWKEKEKGKKLEIIVTDFRNLGRKNL